MKALRRAEIAELFRGVRYGEIEMIAKRMLRKRESGKERGG